MKRAVGIDFGKARIGLALSDPGQMIATPFNVLFVDKSDAPKTTAQKLMKLLEPYQNEIEILVIGHPLELSGKPGPMAKAAEAFAEVLEKESSHKIALWDERLTTAQVDRGFKEAGFSRKKRASLADAASACITLQSFLDQPK